MRFEFQKVGVMLGRSLNLKSREKFQNGFSIAIAEYHLLCLKKEVPTSSKQNELGVVVYPCNPSELGG